MIRTPTGPEVTTPLQPDSTWTRNHFSLLAPVTRDCAPICPLASEGTPKTEPGGIETIMLRATSKSQAKLCSRSQRVLRVPWGPSKSSVLSTPLLGFNSGEKAARVSCSVGVEVCGPLNSPLGRAVPKAQSPSQPHKPSQLTGKPTDSFSLAHLMYRPQTDVLRGWLPPENLGTGPFPTRAPTCSSFLLTVPLELAHHSNNNTTAALSGLLLCANQDLGASFKPTGKGPATQHKSESRSCQDPGSELALGNHLPALGLSLLICKMGVADQIM